MFSFGTIFGSKPSSASESQGTDCQMRDSTTLKCDEFNSQRPVNVPRIVVDSVPHSSPVPSTTKFSFDLPMLGVSPSSSDVNVEENMPGAYRAHRRPRRTSSSRGLLFPPGTRPPIAPEVQISRSRRSSRSSRAPSPDLSDSYLGRRTRSPESTSPSSTVKMRLVKQKDVQKEELFEKMQNQLIQGEDIQKNHDAEADTMGAEGMAVTDENSTIWKGIIEMKDRELKNLNEDLEKAEVMLKANEANLAKANRTLQEQGDELTRLNDGLRNRDMNLLKMAQDMEVLTSEIAGRDGEITTLSAEVAARRAEAETMVQANQAILEKANQTLQEQGGELTRLSDGLRYRDNNLLEIGQEMGGLRLEIAKRDEEIAILSAEVTTRRKEADKMAEEIISLKQTDKDRQEERTELENKMDTMMTVMKEMKGEIDGLKASAEDARLRAYRAEERTMEALAEYDKEKRRADDADAALKDLRLSTDKKPLSWGNDVDMTHTPAKVPFTPVRRWPAPPPLPNPQKPHTVIDLDDSSDDDMNVDRSILLPKPQLQPQHRIATPGPSTTPTTTPPTRHNIPTSQPASRSVHFTSLKGKEPELQRPLTPTSMPKVTGKPKDTSNPRTPVVPKPIVPRGARKVRQASLPPPRTPRLQTITTPESDFLDLTLEEKVNVIYLRTGPNKKEATTSRSAYRSGFVTPRKRQQTDEWQNNLNSAVRHSIEEYMGIKATKGVLQLKDDVFAKETAMKNQIARFEKYGRDVDEPTLEPMTINFDKIKGRWNEAIFEKFVQAHETKDNTKYSEEEIQEIQSVFYRRLERMLTELNKVRPKGEEFPEDVEERVRKENERVAAISRRNGRRTQLEFQRTKIILEHMPDDQVPIDDLDMNAKAWTDVLRMHEALGLHGQSSDESDGGEGHGTYEVRKLKWRHPDVIRRYGRANPKKHALNLYGKRKTGALPRDRVRPRHPTESARPPPIGLPLNLYDPAWYDELRAGAKRDLQAKPAMEFLTSADADN